MANFRALAIDTTGLGYQEIADTDTLRVGNIQPAAGNLTLGGAAGGSNVLITSGQTLTIDGAAAGLNLTNGANLTASVGSDLSGFDTIEGILSGNLVDKTASELITGQWTYQANNTTNPKLIVKAAGGEAANSLMFQVQNSLGANLFSVDVEGDVVIAGGETVAGTTIYTGNVTLGDGGNTIQVGSAATPAVGDNVYINTTGTANGNFAVTTANFNIATNGDLDTAGDITLTGGGTITTTANGNLTLSANGTGVINASVNLNAQAGLDVSGAALTSSGGLTLTVTGITMTGLDIGAALTRAGTGYFTTLNSTGLTLLTNGITMTGLDIGTGLARAGTGYFTAIDATTITGTLSSSSYGTNAVAWVTNLDAAAGTPEDVITVSAAGDGANIQAWRWFNDSSAKQFLLQYAQNPASLTNPATAYTLNALVADSTGTVDFPYNVNAQAGLDVTNAALTVDANGIDCGGGIDLDGALSFDGVTASTIDTSGNNPLSITVGTDTLDVTAGLVDLATSVTALDVPDGTAFMIGGTALTTANFTATNVDTLLDGSNADALHTHAAVNAGELVLPGLTVTGGGTVGNAYYISSNDTVSKTNASSGGGSFTSATFAGVYDGNAGEVVINGKVTAQFEAGLVPAPAAGDPAILSYTTAGLFTNAAPAVGSGHWLTRVGIVLNASGYAGSQTCTIVIQPDRPIKR